MPPCLLGSAPPPAWLLASTAPSAAPMCPKPSPPCPTAHPPHTAGELRCTYRAYNEMDEVAPAHSLAFDLAGGSLYCGFGRGTVRAFKVERPGRYCCQAGRRGVGWGWWVWAAYWVGPVQAGAACLQHC